jgi:alcohol dehydrogenase (cytochrome c)
VVWEHKYIEPNVNLHSHNPSILTTAGGLLFTGDPSGNFMGMDAKTGAILWHDELPDGVTFGVPISYKLDGKQYILAAAGTHLVAYTLGK